MLVFDSFRFLDVVVLSLMSVRMIDAGMGLALSHFLLRKGTSRLSRLNTGRSWRVSQREKLNNLILSTKVAPHGQEDKVETMGGCALRPYAAP